jgi:signal transduction histidine kinase
MNQGTILCVDDDATVLRALRSLLSNLGNDFIIEIAEGGEEALEIAQELKEQETPLAVVISDFIMPGMRGDELLISLHQLYPSAITIMLTGQNDVSGVKRAINEANLYRFLEKPFDNDDLLLTIKSACQAYQNEREVVRQNTQLKALNTDLEEMVSLLERQQQDLTRSEAKATISTLVASVSHELGTPIGNIVLTADSLVEVTRKFKLAVETNQMSRTGLGSFIDTVTEASSLLHGNVRRASSLLLNFKQVAADQASEQRRTFELGTVVREIVDTMKPSLRNKPHRVVLNIAQDIGMDSFPGALGQIVINLINNAYLHAFEGCTDGVLTIHANLQGNAVHMSFSDNGVGISQENLVRLMEPFFSTKVGRGGTGLGMSIVATLV